jgi:hypothetical protein
MSGVIVDTDHVWTVLMDVGGKKEVELPLFQVTTDVFVEASFADKIRQLMLEYDHYLPGNNVTSIESPQSRKILGKALFVVVCFLKDYAEDMTGSLNHFLFGEMRDHRYRLIAAADRGLTSERFKFFMRVITRKPELVKNLVLTHQTQ